MSKKIVIGLVGPKTCGKSTVTNILSEFYRIEESALADKLKNVCAEVFHLKRIQFDSQELKELEFEESKQLTSEKIVKILELFGINANSYRDPVLMQTYLDSFKGITNRLLGSPREVAQIVGTEILRSIDKDVHCKTVNISDKHFTVVSDVRFSNEFDYFSNLSGVTFIPIYIQRDVAEGLITPNSHSSETDFMNFRQKCFKVDNNGSLKDTERQVKQIVDKVLHGGN